MLSMVNETLNFLRTIRKGVVGWSKGAGKTFSAGASY